MDEAFGIDSHVADMGVGWTVEIGSDEHAAEGGEEGFNGFDAGETDVEAADGASGFGVDYGMPLPYRFVVASTGLDCCCYVG